MALAAAAAQAVWMPHPSGHILSYLAIWIGTAVAATSLIASQTVTRTKRIHSGLADEMLRMAIEQFLPSVLAGALITTVLYLYVPSSLWLLPGIWQIIFSLGVFSSCRFLPRRMVIAGAWYLMTGLVALAAGMRVLFLLWQWVFPMARDNCLSREFFISMRRSMAMKTKNLASTSEGRFAYEGLDRVIHERARLSILTSLITNPKGLAFGDLKELCSLTDGNLNRHLRVLEQGKMVEIVKGHGEIAR